MTARTLVERVIDGDPRAIARAITLIENDAPTATEVVRGVFPKTGRAFLVGVTGAPGAGKSTLVDALTSAIRHTGKTVGVVAVDPTSPFTGGAILGDRVRMQAHASDRGVFIRSMATRGHLGGLARATSEAALVLDAAGFDVVLIETVGVGQDEVDIVRTADISVVLVVPGAGDDVQALKAGIMEIADIFVVNKADREGADRAAAAIETLLSLQSFGPGEWRPPILRTVASTGTGVSELVDAIERFRGQAKEGAGARRRTRAEWRLRELLSQRFLQHVERHILQPGELDEILSRIAARDLDPYSASDAIVARAVGEGRSRVASGSGSRVVSGSGSRVVSGFSRTDIIATLDHIGIAVANIDEALGFYRDALGLEVEVPEEVPSQRVRAHFIPAGEAALELLEATADDSPIGKFVSKRGPGLHHITLAVDDIRAALARLKAHGARLIDESPRPGAHGSLVAFVHPASTHGVLLELKQRSAAHGET